MAYNLIHAVVGDNFHFVATFHAFIHTIAIGTRHSCRPHQAIEKQNCVIENERTRNTDSSLNYVEGTIEGGDVRTQGLRILMILSLIHI